MFILPSRERPHNVKRLIDAWQATKAAALVYLLLDDDDAHRYEALDLPVNWAVVIAPRQPIAMRQEQMFAWFPGESYYGFLADDVVPKTECWDQRLIEAAGHDGVAFANDTINGDRFATHPVIGGDLVRRMGWLTLPGLQHLYVDAVWTEIGRRLGVLRYVGDVTVEHRHFSNRKAFFDKTYQDHSRFADSDRRLFENWRKDYQCAS